MCEIRDTVSIIHLKYFQPEFRIHNLDFGLTSLTKSVLAQLEEVFGREGTFVGEQIHHHLAQAGFYHHRHFLTG